MESKDRLISLHVIRASIFLDLVLDAISCPRLIVQGLNCFERIERVIFTRRYRKQEGDSILNLHGKF